jgi:hypothetical protein
VRRIPFVVAVVVGVVCAAIAAGVTYTLVHDDAHAAAPVVLAGLLRDKAGHPVSNATLRLEASDDANAKVGDTIPVAELASGRTDSAGRFTIRQSPSVPMIRKLAAENGGWVNFEVLVGSQTCFAYWGVPRKLGPNGWITDDDRPAAVQQERITCKSSG